MEQDNNVLRYKNIYMFYEIIYKRLFKLIDIFIDEKDFNIKTIKNKLIDFLDCYSYYLAKQKLITIHLITNNLYPWKKSNQQP
jgi:hypothetical protein